MVVSTRRATALSGFIPAGVLSNPHVQTLLPRLMYQRRDIEVITRQLDLPDGDFVDLAWCNPPDADSREPIVAIFHGLEGSLHSPYASGMLAAIARQDWHGVLMHFRGCSGRPNRLARSYHSGETGDARYFLSWLQQQYPHSPLAAIGYSLGGNMLLKLQAEYGDTSPLRAAVSVSAPLLLDRCSDRIHRGFSRIYERHLLDSLKRSVLRKFAQHDYETLIGLTPQRLRRADSFWDFDDIFTAPVHGFRDARDYYRQSSAYYYLPAIKTASLIIHALDDPFMTADILPEKASLPINVNLAVSRHGGHVGFVEGSVWRPRYWLERYIPAYLATYLVGA